MLEKTEFHSGATGVDEIFFAMNSIPRRGDFRGEAAALLDRYLAASAGTHCVFCRLHVSDIANQYEILMDLCQARGIEDTVAIIGQRPLDGGKIALEAWHFGRSLQNVTVKVVRMPECRGFSGSYEQTRREFDFLGDVLADDGRTIAGDVVRTWIYCRDIDNNYQGLVVARRELFNQINLTEKTHYIASTGIEGKPYPCDRLVRMDSLAVWPLADGQLEYMHAPDHLSPTHIYGVTFERGTRMIHADRSHYFISGTASIDRDGKIVHPGDVGAQTLRLIENVGALLANHEGTLADLKQAVIYLRDDCDREEVESILSLHLPEGCVRVFVTAGVCRPGWLVEMDAIAVNKAGCRKFEALE
ncbi:MAG: Rid family hydrolase [Victivallaceae bacterium]|nr:Rid family hydrolase [Victivallaceae bacterium]